MQILAYCRYLSTAVCMSAGNEEEIADMSNI